MLLENRSADFSILQSFLAGKDTVRYLRIGLAAFESGTPRWLDVLRFANVLQAFVSG